MNVQFDVNMCRVLAGVLMPQGAHSVGSFIKALKQHGPTTSLALVQRAEELIRVVAHLHSDLSKDVRGRDVELFQEMWTGYWVIQDQTTTCLRVASGSHDLARLKKMRDRLLLDLGLGGHHAVQHQNVTDLNHLLQAPGH